MRRRAWWAVGLLAVAGVMASPFACSVGGGSAFNDDDDDGSGLTGAGGDGTGAAGGGFMFDAGDNDGSLGDGDICEGVEETAQPLPLHMILAIDRSGSMDYYGYWAPLQQALIQFIQDPLSAGLFIGLNYFPAPSGGDSCNVGLWNPVQVPAGAPPMAELPTDAQVLINNINSTGTGNMTPMWGALEGSYQFAQTLLAAYPNDKVIVVLASDGIPTECGGNYENINWIASNTVAPAYNNLGIETYAIAIDANVVDEMNIIAAAGGTTQCYDVSQNTSAFAQKMAEIRGSALGCEYLIPDSSVDFDPFKVNVSITIGGGTPQTIPQADNAADCGTGDGWYYDDPVNPTMIILCPATCQAIETAQQNQEEVDVDVKFGCPTEVN